jgi:hypothetical protein
MGAYRRIAQRAVCDADESENSALLLRDKVPGMK